VGVRGGSGIQMPGATGASGNMGLIGITGATGATGKTQIVFSQTLF